MKVDHCKLTLNLTMPNNRYIMIVESLEINTKNNSKVIFGIVLLSPNFDLIVKNNHQVQKC